MSTPATDAQGSRDARAALRPFIAPLLCAAVCLMLFPAFTVVYVAWAQAQNNHKFCGVVDAVVAPQPPSGSTAGKPGQAYDQNLYLTFEGLKVRLGC